MRESEWGQGGSESGGEQRGKVGAGERGEGRHERCGAVLVVSGAATVAGPGEDCEVCAEVRRWWREYGVLRASAGTPLFEELGGRVLRGEVGAVK